MDDQQFYILSTVFQSYKDDVKVVIIINLEQKQKSA